MKPLCKCVDSRKHKDSCYIGLSQQKPAHFFKKQLFHQLHCNDDSLDWHVHVSYYRLTCTYSIYHWSLFSVSHNLKKLGKLSFYALNKNSNCNWYQTVVAKNLIANGYTYCYSIFRSWHVLFYMYFGKSILTWTYKKHN